MYYLSLRDGWEITQEEEEAEFTFYFSVIFSLFTYGNQQLQHAMTHTSMFLKIKLFLAELKVQPCTVSSRMSLALETIWIHPN